MIGMTLASLEAVILISDPDQLPPTVISQPKSNEGANYLVRSLLSRLRDAGYPLTRLLTNYRCHSAIMGLFNEVIYGGPLELGPHNDELERVGHAWGAFTESRYYLKEQGRTKVRRMFINVSGVAQKREGEASWINLAEVHTLVDTLRSLYRFRVPSGDQVHGEDVMIIAPYRAQQNLIKSALDHKQLGYKDILTVDAAQGQEAPVVFLLLSENPKSLGFNADHNRLNVAISRTQKVLSSLGTSKCGTRALRSG
jgi:superfamily I DNA and/or RNA helicase